MTDRTRAAAGWRMLWILVGAGAIASSLLVFPGLLLRMVAFWMAAATVTAYRGRPVWFPLSVCVAVLLIKRPDWSPALTAFGASMAIAVAFLFWKRIPSHAAVTSRLPALITIGLLWLFWAASVWESYVGTRAGDIAPFDPHRPIVCIGDSLTTGMSDHEAYPVYLEQLVRAPVLNFGRAGIPTRDAIKQLPAALESHPQAVIVELGGHDFLRGYGRAATRESLVEIIDACRNAGATVVLVEIPRGFITDSFAGLERELARKFDLELLSDLSIRMLVVRSPAIPVVGDWAVPHLSDDGLHPNVAGARYLAESVYQSLLRMYGPEINANR